MGTARVQAEQGTDQHSDPLPQSAPQSNTLRSATGFRGITMRPKSSKRDLCEGANPLSVSTYQSLALLESLWVPSSGSSATGSQVLASEFLSLRLMVSHNLPLFIIPALSQDFLLQLLWEEWTQG